MQTILTELTFIYDVQTTFLHDASDTAREIRMAPLDC